MKAALLTGIRELEIQDVPEPTIKQNSELLIKVGAVGVCGSDIHYYETGRIGNQIVDYPFRIGHECSGIVEEVGNGVGKISPGDRIAIDPAVSCYECDQCKAGRFHTCRNLQFMGHPQQLAGCLAEYIVMPESSCYKVNRETTLDDAAFVEPLSIGAYAVKLMDSAKVEKVAVIGAGPIGLSVLATLNAREIETIYATDKINDRRVVAEKAGAKWTGNPDESDIVQDIRDQEPQLLDTVFECCGDQEALDQAIDLLKPGGELLIVGIPETERISFDISDLRHKEITIKNVRRQNESMQAALDLVENGSVDAELFITHRFDLADTKEAYDLVAGYRDGVVKAMIEIE